MTEACNWSPQQDDALAAVRDWRADPSGAQVFRLFGYAGTGKTTLARESARNWLYTAVTRAASQLTVMV
jgi:tRNA A37 threonylcarbamoyladenosine biosynthesis protein TsaE